MAKTERNCMVFGRRDPRALPGGPCWNPPGRSVEQWPQTFQPDFLRSAGDGETVHEPERFR